MPDIARYFGITVDELLQIDKIDENEYFEECSGKSENLFRNGKRDEIIPIWLDAYKKMPNSICVKEMLMSIYFDTDKVKYQNEIIELGTEIYNTDSDSSYYKGQAINLIARTYAENGNREKAEIWARKAHQINHSQEFLFMQITDNGEELVHNFGFTNHWYFDRLFYMTARLNMCDVKINCDDYIQKVNMSVASIFELVYPNDDMSFESLGHLCMLYRCIAEDETRLGKNENMVKKYLTRAVECALKSVTVKAHDLKHPLFYGWKIADAPSDNLQIVHTLKDELMWQCFDEYRNQDFFSILLEKLENVEK